MNAALNTSPVVTDLANQGEALRGQAPRARLVANTDDGVDVSLDSASAAWPCATRIE
jgi:hypothetical protein